MMKSSSHEVDNQMKLVLVRLNHTEKLFEELCSGFGAYSRKSARLRDKTDDLAKIFNSYSSLDPEKYAVSKLLSNLGKTMTFLADFRDDEVQRIESKIIGEMGQYDLVCKAMREELKINSSIRNKEILRKKRDQLKAGSASRAQKEFEKIVEDFEEQKNKDLKELMSDFVQIELKMHIQSVNNLIAIYKEIQDLDERKDLLDLKAKLFGENDTDLGKLNKVRSHSMGALNIFHANQFKRNLKNVSKINKSQTSLDDDSDHGPQFRKPIPKITLTTKETSIESIENDEGVTDTETESEETEKITTRKQHLHVAGH